MDTSHGTFVISHTSALELLRQPGFRWYLDQGRCDVPACPRWDPSVARVRMAQAANGCIGDLEEPLHITAGDDCRGRDSGCRIIHRHRGALPANSLIDAGFGVFCASPELCLVQLAGGIERTELLPLTMELCGTYRLGTDQTLYNQAPLTNVVTLRAFTSQAQVGSTHGAQRLLWVLRYAADGSASPRETAVHGLLCLPTRQGGYGLPLPHLNYPVETRDTRLETSRRTSYRFDLCWPSCKLALEYDSDEFHSNAAQLALDAEKRTVAQQLGYTVVSLTNSQLCSVDAMDELAKLLSAKMGHRLRIRTKGFAMKQYALRKTLLGPQHA